MAKGKEFVDGQGNLLYPVTRPGRETYYLDNNGNRIEIPSSQPDAGLEIDVIKPEQSRQQIESLAKSLQQSTQHTIEGLNSRTSKVIGGYVQIATQPDTDKPKITEVREYTQTEKSLIGKIFDKSRSLINKVTTTRARVPSLKYDEGTFRLPSGFIQYSEVYSKGGGDAEVSIGENSIHLSAYSKQGQTHRKTVSQGEIVETTEQSLTSGEASARYGSVNIDHGGMSGASVKLKFD